MTGGGQCARCAISWVNVPIPASCPNCGGPITPAELPVYAPPAMVAGLLVALSCEATTAASTYLGGQTPRMPSGELLAALVAAGWVETGEPAAGDAPDEAAFLLSYEGYRLAEGLMRQYMTDDE